MKKTNIFLAILTLAMAFGLGACGKKENLEAEASQSAESLGANGEEKEDLIVFAAASMTDVLEEIKDKYEKENPNVNLIFNFDSSGTLKTQIEEGAPCDIFISAAQKQMNELDPKNENYLGKASIDDGSRLDLLENKVCLVVAEDGDIELSKFEDLATEKVNTIALGNEDVPVGQYSEEILNNLGIYDKVMEKTSLGSNVREVASWISEKTADAGIVYSTDAKAFGLKVVAEADDSMLDNKVIYPAAILDNAKNKKEAKEFLSFLLSDEAGKIFQEAGFSLAK